MPILANLLGRLRASLRLRDDAARRIEALHQVAALPVRRSRSGKLKVLLISTRRSSKLIVPRGWPMPGKPDFQAAAIEAEQEAGVLGPVTLRPIGSYEYRHARKASGRPIRVDVYRLDVTRRQPKFKERRERRLLWLSVAEASRQVDEPGLVPIIERLSTSASEE